MHDIACQTTRNFTPSTLVAIALFVVTVSTQSATAFRTLVLDRLATRSLAQMAMDAPAFHKRGGYLLTLYAATLLAGATLATVPHTRKRIDCTLTRVALALSTVSWGLALLPSYNSAEKTDLGAVVMGEFVLMFLVQLSSAASGLLPLYSVLVGPFGAIALTPHTTNDLDVRSPLAVVVSFFMVFLLMPCVDAHPRPDLVELITHGSMRELFAFVHVAGGALLLAVRFMPVVHRGRLARDALRLALFAVSIHHNVAAAWFLVL